MHLGPVAIHVPEERIFTWLQALTQLAKRGVDEMISSGNIPLRAFASHHVRALRVVVQKARGKFHSGSASRGSTELAALGECFGGMLKTGVATKLSSQAFSLGRRTRGLRGAGADAEVAGRATSDTVVWGPCSSLVRRPEATSPALAAATAGSLEGVWAEPEGGAPKLAWAGASKAGGAMAPADATAGGGIRVAVRRGTRHGHEQGEKPRRLGPQEWG